MTLTPVKYLVDGTSVNGRGGIYVEQRAQRDGSILWCIVTSFSEVFNRDLQWEWEPMPSSRTDEFIARTRFTFEEACELVKQINLGL